MLADDYDSDELRPHAERLTREALAAHLREQSTWPERTDCDLLDAAFTELEQAGIVARQNYSCCGNCGTAEIWEEIMGAAAGGGGVRGYTFYHMQDTERAVEGGGVYLSYGALKEGVRPALEIAGEIVSTIRRHGLRVEWSGTWLQRIHVSLDWRRRR